jgi:hypothetical protein
MQVKRQHEKHPMTGWGIGRYGKSGVDAWGGADGIGHRFGPFSGFGSVLRAMSAHSVAGVNVLDLDLKTLYELDSIETGVYPTAGETAVCRQASTHTTATTEAPRGVSCRRVRK